MMTIKNTLSLFRIPPDEKIKLRDHDPGWEGDQELPEDERRRTATELLAKNIEELSAAQELLYAADSWSVLVVLQALDAAGKDGTIKHVLSGVNPQGVQVVSFKRPSPEEFAHWRCIQDGP